MPTTRRHRSYKLPWVSYVRIVSVERPSVERPVELYCCNIIVSNEFVNVIQYTTKAQVPTEDGSVWNTQYRVKYDCKSLQTHKLDQLAYQEEHITQWQT